MNTARWVQRAAFAGAVGLGVLAFAPTAGHAAASPPQVFYATGGTSGVEYTFDERPQPSQVTDLIHGSTPYASSTLAGVGSSTALAASVYLGGLQGLPGLICTAAGADDTGKPYCDQIPPAGTFPPAPPLTAYAQYPSTPSDTATIGTNKPVGGGGAPLSATTGKTYAEAKSLSALADATLGKTTFVGGLVSTGSSSTVTSQSINAAGAVVSRAETVVNDVHLFNLISIGSVHSIVEIVYDGKNKPKITNTTEVYNSSANGVGVTIDDKGVHVVGQTNTTAAKILNEQLNYLLSGDGFTVKAIGATTTFENKTVDAQSGGLIMDYDNTVSGAPQAPPITAIPYCTKILAAKALKPIRDNILANIPADLCTPPAPPSINGRYFGTVTIGRAGAIVSASQFDTDLGVPDGSGFVPGTPPVPPTTTFTAGTPGTPGTAGTPGTPGSTSGEAPQVAGGNNAGSVGFVENLGNAAERLKYLFPAFLLAVIGVLAGRAGPAPARLPRTVS